MALSASYDFNLTRNEIITEAFRDIGVIDEGNDTPTASQLAVGARRLNMIVKNLQVRVDDDEIEELDRLAEDIDRKSVV